MTKINRADQPSCLRYKMYNVKTITIAGGPAELFAPHDKNLWSGPAELFALQDV
jgi:hypothetical protein